MVIEKAIFKENREIELFSKTIGLFYYFDQFKMVIFCLSNKRRQKERADNIGDNFYSFQAINFKPRLIL